MFTSSSVYGKNEKVRFSEMIRMVGEVFDRKPRIRSLPMQPGDVERTYANVTKGQELLGYPPSTEFADEMRVFTFWYGMQGVTRDGVKSR